MKNSLQELREVLLMGPGPSCVPPQVYQALSRPTIGHLDPRFIRIMDEIKAQLQQVMQTENSLTIPISGTGSAGMETCFVNLVEPGDRVLVLRNGVFGTRMADVAARLGASVETLDFEWGTPVDLAQVDEKLRDGSPEAEGDDLRTSACGIQSERETQGGRPARSPDSYAIVAIVHAETSTGVCNPVAEVGQLVADTGSLYLVDTVTSLGGMPVSMDEWQADALYSGTQKCLSCPPGLAPISFSERAVAKLQDRQSKVPNWYLDLTLIHDYWEVQNELTITRLRSICCTVCARPCIASSMRASMSFIGDTRRRTNNWWPGSMHSVWRCWSTRRCACRC